MDTQIRSLDTNDGNGDDDGLEEKKELQRKFEEEKKLKIKAKIKLLSETLDELQNSLQMGSGHDQENINQQSKIALEIRNLEDELGENKARIQSIQDDLNKWRQRYGVQQAVNRLNWY